MLKKWLFNKLDLITSRVQLSSLLRRFPKDLELNPASESIIILIFMSLSSTFIIMLSRKDALKLIHEGPRAWNLWRKRHPADFPNLDGIELIGKDLAGIDLSGISLRNTVFNHCNLESASLVSACLFEANLRNNNLKAARMIATDLSHADLTASNLKDANMLTATVSGTRFDKVDLRGQDLQTLDLRRVSFRGANLSNQLLAKSDLSGSILDDCILTDSDLSFANLHETSLVNVNLSNTTLTETRFTQANLSNAIFTSNSLYSLNFEGAKLENCDFRQSTLKHCNFSKADITGCMFWEINAIDWTLTNVKCNYAYWDEQGRQKTYYGSYDFERMYSDVLTLQLKYPFRMSVSEIATLPIFIEHLQASQWGTSIRLKSIKDDAGGSLVTLSIDENSAYQPSELRSSLQQEADSIIMAQITVRQDPMLQAALKEQVASIKETFWPRLLELAAEHERNVIRSLTIIFMDLTGFSRWTDDELTAKLELFRGLVKPILHRWGAAHPNMEGDSLRVSFENATIALACACMLRSVLSGAGFDMRIGIELGEVTITHNVVTNQPDLEGGAVNMAARLEASAEAGEILATEQVKFHSSNRDLFQFVPRIVTLKKAIGNKKAGEPIECYSVSPKGSLDSV